MNNLDIILPNARKDQGIEANDNTYGSLLLLQEHQKKTQNQFANWAQNWIKLV